MVGIACSSVSFGAVDEQIRERLSRHQVARRRRACRSGNATAVQRHTRLPLSSVKPTQLDPSLHSSPAIACADSASVYSKHRKRLRSWASVVERRYPTDSKGDQVCRKIKGLSLLPALGYNSVIVPLGVHLLSPQLDWLSSFFTLVYWTRMGLNSPLPGK